MRIPHPTSVDFETESIEGRPKYPPIPVSVSIKEWGKEPKFYAWGHKTGKNTHTKAQATAAVRKAYACKDGVLFHNARFDVDVAETHFGVAVPPWQAIHDTMLLLFLRDPNNRNLELKYNAQRILQLPPDERDAVAEWLVENQPVAGVKIGLKAKGKEPPGKYIAWAPPEIVGPYANGDVVRSELLFENVYPYVAANAMLDAYDRERKLLPILLEMERTGVRVDIKRLGEDVGKYGVALDHLDKWIRRRIGVTDDVNIDSGQQLVNALVEAGLADTTKMGVTKKTGKIKSGKAAIAAGVADADPLFASVHAYYTQLKTCLNTFMTPWLVTARISGGYIYTHWNQTLSPDGGTRTGRFSSSPNFQNMPKEFEPIFREDAARIVASGILAGKELEEMRVKAKKLPKMPFPLPPLPLCRSYIVPYEMGHVLCGRDYSQQEPRILGHFENGNLMEQYQDNPWLDMHDNAKERLEAIYKRTFKRKPVKNINLGIIYGQGVPSLAVKNGESIEDTKQLRESILLMYPGLKDLGRDMKIRAKLKKPIRTWGGREYYCEPPSFIDGKIQTWDYKMVNTLIQGSAADCTKEGMIRFYERLGGTIEEAIKRFHNRGWRLLLQVHDEIVLSVPAHDLVEAQEWLRAAMESVEFDVQILSEGAWSNDNWSVMVDFDKKGNRVPQKLPRQQRKTA